MGVVYQATQVDLDRRVAVKVISPQFAHDPEFRRRFKQEARLAAGLAHEHVVAVHAAGEESGHLYVVMRLVSGTDLAQHIAQRGRLPPPTVATIVAQVAGALDSAHGAGLVHRDIKPANIVIGGTAAEPHAYLTDFGLTKHVAASTSAITAPGQWLGTIDYAAPEQINGDRVDARADIYALGCVLFHALAGRVPFVRDSEAAKLWAHLNAEPPVLSQVVPGLSPNFDALIIRAMAKEPALRFSSAGDLGRAAVAAAHARVTAEPERVVARGDAAATSPTEVLIAPTAAGGASRDHATGPTAIKPSDKPVRTTRRRPILVTVLVALVAVLGVWMALRSGHSSTKVAKQPHTVTRSATTSATAGYRLYVPNSLGYKAELPRRGWHLTPESQVNPGLFRTVVTGPYGAMLWIDYTPHERATFDVAGRNVLSRTQLHQRFYGYATRYVFRGGLPQCAHRLCVDYVVGRRVPGHGVLVAGANLARIEGTARKIVLSLKPYR
jgi:hypothetical protein